MSKMRGRVAGWSFRMLFIVLSISICFILPLGVIGADCIVFKDLIENGGYAIADGNGVIVDSCRADRFYTPASVLKVPTALVALRVLGPTYRFRTRFYRDQQHNLYIKGYGDPMLISEEVALILRNLTARGVDRINGIFVDDSSFEGLESSPGVGRSDNPYDVPLGAAAVNFNTVAIRVNKQGEVVSNEKQTPTLPIMRDLGANLPPGRYRLNICQDRIKPREVMARYTAELFRALQERAAIPGTGRMGLARVPQEAELIYEHRNSRDLTGVIQSFLKYSSNFTANLVFLACGAEKLGYPVSWEKGRIVMSTALSELLGRETAREIYMVEGSGLSRENKVTARAIIKVLEHFSAYSSLLPEKGGPRLKSGTLRGVYSYAGYLENGEPFVILLNQKDNSRDTLLARMRSFAAARRVPRTAGDQ